MKTRMLIMTLVLACLAFSGISAYTPVQAAEQKTDAERKKYLDEQKRKIDRQAEREIDRVLDGQKGLGNSGASQRKIAEIERQRDAQKKALDDHYRQGSTNVVGLDGKRKGTPQAAPAPNKPTAAGTVKSPTAKAPHYVVGVDGKRRLVSP